MTAAPLTVDELRDLYNTVKDIQLQLRGPGLKGWHQLGQNAQGQDLTLVDAYGAMEKKLDALTAAVAKLSPNAVPAAVPFQT